MLSAIRNAFKVPDLRRKIFFTLFIILIYRLGANIPNPGIDHAAVQQLVRLDERRGHQRRGKLRRLLQRDVIGVHAQVAEGTRRTLGHQNVDQLARTRPRVEHAGLRDALISCLPGYADAPWEWNDRTIPDAA